MKTATDSIGIQRQLPVWGAIAAIPPKAGQRAWKRGGATLLALVVSGAGLWWLMSDSVVAAFTAAMQRAGIWDLAAAGALFPIIQWLRAWRFSLLVTGRVETSSWRMFAITSRLLLFNYLLPFKLGEVSFPLMVQRTFGIDFLRATGVLIVVRVMDLCVVSTVMALGVMLLADGEAHSWWQSPLLTGTGVIVSILMVVGPELLGLALRTSRRLRRKIPWVDGLLWLAASSHTISQRLLALGLTLAIWLGQWSLAYFAARAITTEFGFFQIMFASGAATLAFALPVSGLAGLGPPQAAWATALHLTGSAWAPAIATALMCHGVVLTGALAIGFITFLVPVWQPTFRPSGRADPAAAHPAWSRAMRFRGLGSLRRRADMKVQP